MRARTPHFLLGSWLTSGLLVVASACTTSASAPASTRASSGDGAHRVSESPDPATGATTGGTPLILAADEGERRVRRTLGGARLVLKVDPETASSPEFVMSMEAIPPGEGIPPHVHPSADEIIFVHQGAGAVELGDRRAAVSSGATVYIPRSTRVTIRNTGTEPLVIVAIFSHTGFEAYLRDTSVREGETVTPLTPAELAAIRQRHSAHVVFERP
jgi:mannose-6-phosphate isomerase-like protein (cupin superfamily)